MGVLCLYRENDMTIPAATEVNEILADVFALGLFNNRLDLFADVVLAKLGIEVDLTSVVWDDELDILYNVVVETIAMLTAAEFTTVVEVKDYVSSIAGIGALIKDEVVVNEVTINHVLNIVELLLGSQILEIAYAPAYEKAATKLVNRLGLPAAMADAEKYAFASFLADAKAGIQIVRELLAFHVLDIVRVDGYEIEWSNTTPVENIIKLGFGMNFLNIFDKEVFEFLGAKLGKDLTSDVLFENIKWAQDGETFADAYALVASTVLASKDFSIKTLAQLRARDLDVKALIKDAYVLAVLEAADMSINTTLVEAFVLKALELVNNYVPAELQFVIAESSISSSQAVEDLRILIDIVETAVKAGALDLYHDRDMAINPGLYDSIIGKLFDLNITKSSDVRVRLINLVLDKVGLESIDSISDWDNEENVLKATVTEVCAFLANNDVTTLKGLLSFVRNREFLSKEFVTDANALDILDIAEAAIKSELVLKVSASVYSEVVTKLPADVQTLVGFGNGVNDYYEELYYLDAPQFIAIAKKAVELGVLDIYRERDMVIPTAAQINDILADVFALGLFNNRLDLFFDYVFNKLGLEVDLTGIDWDNEIDVLYYVIEQAVPVLVNGGTTTLQETLRLARTIVADVKGFVRYNRTYVNLANAYVGLDILEKLGTSEVYMRSITKVVNLVASKLPGNIVEYIDLTQYPENELRADYPNIIEIIRNALDGRVYEVLTQRRGWAFPVEAQTALENIVALGCDLHFTARYTEGMIRLVGSVAGINNLPSNLSDIDLAADKPLLVSLVGMARNIWIGTNNLHPQFAMLANKPLFEEIYTALDTTLSTTLVNVMLPWAYESYVAPRLNSLPIPAEYVDLSRLAGYRGAEVIELFDDILAAYASALDMNVFGTEGINFTNKAHLTNIVNLMLKHVELHAKLEDYLVRFVNKSDRMGVIVVPYAEVTSTRAELSAMKGIVSSLRDLASKYGSALGNLSILASAGFENDVMALLNKVGESVLLEATFIPVVNGLADIVIGDEYYLGYTAVPCATFDEFKAEVGGLFDILQKANELGFLNKNIKYKDTYGMKAMFQMIEASVFFNGQEGIILEFLLGKTDYINPDDVDLVSIDFSNEYQYLYNFLDKAYAPLNMPGITIGTDLINNSAFMSQMTEALAELADSQVLVEFFLPLVDFASGKYPTVKDVLDYSHLDKEDAGFATIVHDEYLSILSLMNDVSSLGILDGNMDRIHVDTLLNVYDNVFALEGTQNTQDELLEELVLKLDILGRGVEIPADIDWDQEKGAIRALIASLSHFADTEGYAEINADTIVTTTNVAALEAILTALNNSQIYRVQLFDVLSEEIDGMGASGDFVIADFLTPWFKDQQVNGMLPTADWAQEVIYFARVLAIVNHLNNNGGITDFASIELGTMVGNAATVDTNDFEVEQYGFRQLLQLMSKSQSFTLTALNGTLDSLLVDRTIDGSGSGAIKTQKHLPELSDAEWDIEIDNLVNVIANIQDLGILTSTDSMADQLKGMAEEDIADLIKSFNNSQVLRVVLPDFIYDAVKNADATDYASEWLSVQVGVDAGGNNKPVAPKAEWDAEAENLAAVIKSIGDVDFANLDLNNITPDELDDLENIVSLMNNTKSFVLDPLVDMINDLLTANGLTVQVLGVFDKDSNGTNKNEWALEIGILFDIIEGLNDLNAINDQTIANDSAKLGKLLNIMKTSYLFGNDVKGDGTTTTDDNVFNALVIEILDTNNLFSDTSANGFIDRTTAENDDWAAYNWETELAIVSTFNTATGANEDFIRTAQSSQIISKYFDIAGYVNDYIDAVVFTLEIVPGYTVSLTLAEYVNGITGRTDGKFVNSDFEDRDWADEINDMEALVNVFNGTTDTNVFIHAIEDLDVTYQANIAASEKPTLAVHFGHLLKVDIISSVNELRADFEATYPFLPNPIPTGESFWAAALA